MNILFWVFAIIGILVVYFIIGFIFLRVMLHVCVTKWKMDWDAIWTGDWHWAPAIGWPIYIILGLFWYGIICPSHHVVTAIGGLAESHARNMVSQNNSKCCRTNK